SWIRDEEQKKTEFEESEDSPPRKGRRDSFEKTGPCFLGRTVLYLKIENNSQIERKHICEKTSDFVPAVPAAERLRQ
ncbi:hypothetical protein, partial [Dysosmobacter sp.]